MHFCNCVERHPSPMHVNRLPLLKVASVSSQMLFVVVTCDVKQTHTVTCVSLCKLSLPVTVRTKDSKMYYCCTFSYAAMKTCAELLAECMYFVSVWILRYFVCIVTVKIYCISGKVLEHCLCHTAAFAMPPAAAAGMFCCICAPCNMVGSTWWVLSLFRSVAGQLFLQYFDAVGWVFWPVKLSPG